MSEGNAQTYPGAIAAFHVHETQFFAGALISRIFGPFADSQPELWTRRTFLLLVAKVYERLVIDKQQLTSKDFHEIAKTLVEITRADVNPRKRNAPRNAGTRIDEGSTEALAEELARIVREIYGVNADTTGSGKNLATDPGVVR